MLFKFPLIHIADWSPRKWVEATAKNIWELVCQVMLWVVLRSCLLTDPAFQNLLVQSGKGSAHWRILLAEFKFVSSATLHPGSVFMGMWLDIPILNLNFSFHVLFPWGYMECIGNTARRLKIFDINIRSDNIQQAQQNTCTGMTIRLSSRWEASPF